MARWKDKPQLVALAGDETIPLTSTSGGAKVGGGTVAAGGDAHTTPAQVRAFATQIEIVSTITSGTITPTGTTDLVRPAALTAALTIANPTGTLVDGASFEVQLYSAAAQGLTWGSKYADRMGALPATTVAGKYHYIGLEYNAADDKFYCRYAQVQA